MEKMHLKIWGYTLAVEESDVIGISPLWEQATQTQTNDDLNECRLEFDLLLKGQTITFKSDWFRPTNNLKETERLKKHTVEYKAFEKDIRLLLGLTEIYGDYVMGSLNMEPHYEESFRSDDDEFQLDDAELGGEG